MSRWREAALRFCGALTGGLAIALALFALGYALGGVHPMDFWWALGLLVKLGVAVGGCCGVVWAFVALLPSRTGS